MEAETLRTAVQLPFLRALNEGAQDGRVHGDKGTRG